MRPLPARGFEQEYYLSRGVVDLNPNELAVRADTNEYHPVDWAAKSVLANLGGLLPELEALYKDSHAHPELSMQEGRTAALTAEGKGVKVPPCSLLSVYPLCSRRPKAQP